MLGTLSWRERWDRGLQYSHIFALYYVISQEYDMIAVVWLHFFYILPKSCPYISIHLTSVSWNLWHCTMIQSSFRISTAQGIQGASCQGRAHRIWGDFAWNNRREVRYHPPQALQGIHPFWGGSACPNAQWFFYVFWRLTGSTTFFWR